jgi:hypothetical protein
MGKRFMYPPYSSIICKAAAIGIAINIQLSMSLSSINKKMAQRKAEPIAAG